MAGGGGGGVYPSLPKAEDYKFFISQLRKPPDPHACKDTFNKPPPQPLHKIVDSSLQPIILAP